LKIQEKPEIDTIWTKLKNLDNNYKKMNFFIQEKVINKNNKFKIILTKKNNNFKNSLISKNNNFTKNL